MEEKEPQIENTEHRFISGKKMQPRDFLTFLTRPGDFFKSDIAIAPNKILYPIVWIVGAGSVIARLDQKALQGTLSTASSNTIFDLVGTSWLHYWLLVVIMAIVNGAILWQLGGWWYNLRLKWCAMNEVDHFEGRVIYTYNSLISGFPVLVLAIISTIVFKDFQTSYSESHWTDMLGLLPMLLFYPYSIINSFRSLIGTYELKTTWTVLWFLALPIVTFLMRIAFFIVALIMYFS